mgnify:CR=1 FL=1
MENGKIIKKIKIIKLSKDDTDITLNKIYDALDMNQLGCVSFLNDAGNWDFVRGWQYEVVEEPRKSLVGRYLKALVDEPNGALYKKGEYIEIADDNSVNVKCVKGFIFGRYEYNWEDSEVELMPEGFEPSHKDESNKPTQYQIGIDTFDRAEANMTKEELLACVRFNIDKYTWRKKGQDEDDFKKIIDYCNYALKQLNK